MMCSAYKLNKQGGCVQVKKHQLKPYMEQETGSKLVKEYIKSICCHPAYSSYV